MANEIDSALRRLRAVRDPAHPLHGCSSAGYALRLARPYEGKTWVLLAAPNAWAIATVELLRSRQLARARPQWRVVSASPEEPALPVDRELAAEVSWLDFVVNVVEPGDLIANAPVAHAFSRSLRGPARRLVLERMASKSEPPRPREHRGSPRGAEASVPVRPRPLETAWVGALTARWRERRGEAQGGA